MERRLLSQVGRPQRPQPVRRRPFAPAPPPRSPPAPPRPPRRRRTPCRCARSWARRSGSRLKSGTRSRSGRGVRCAVSPCVFFFLHFSRAVKRGFPGFERAALAYLSHLFICFYSSVRVCVCACECVCDDVRAGDFQPKYGDSRRAVSDEATDDTRVLLFARTPCRRHCRGQLRNLPKSHHGSVHRVSGEPGTPGAAVVAPRPPASTK